MPASSASMQLESEVTLIRESPLRFSQLGKRAKLQIREEAAVPAYPHARGPSRAVADAKAIRRLHRALAQPFRSERTPPMGAPTFFPPNFNAFASGPLSGLGALSPSSQFGLLGGTILSRPEYR